MVEGLVLVKDHEDVLHLLAQKVDLLLERKVIAPVSDAVAVLVATVGTVPVRAKRHCAG